MCKSVFFHILAGLFSVKESKGKWIDTFRAKETTHVRLLSGSLFYFYFLTVSGCALKKDKCFSFVEESKT